MTSKPESKQAPTPGPDDTVRVSRKDLRTYLDEASTCTDGSWLEARNRLRTALSTPPASPDAGRVERVAKARARAFNPTAMGLFPNHAVAAEAFLAMLDAALATPSAPEDAKGEGVNELAKRIYTAWSKDERFVRDVPGSPQAYFWAEIAARAAASNTERE